MQQTLPRSNNETQLQNVPPASEARGEVMEDQRKKCDMQVGRNAAEGVSKRTRGR